MHDFICADGSGWRASIKKEIDRVVDFRAMEVISAREMHNMISKCADRSRVSIGNFVLPCQTRS